MSAIAEAVNLFEHKNTKRRKRVGRGRGSGLGKTCGKGQKGQKGRSGVGGVRAFEGVQTPLYVRLPHRGFNNIFRVEFKPVNFVQLHECIVCGKLDASRKITIEDLIVAGVIKNKDLVKVLSKGQCPKGLQIEAHAYSSSATAEITKAGGKFEIVQGFEPVSEVQE